MKAILLLTLFTLYSCSESSETSSLVVKGENSISNPTTAARITNISSSNKVYSSGEEINLLISINKSIIVSGSPTLKFDLGSQEKEAVLSNGQGTNTLTFTYLVVDGDEDLNGIELNSVSLNGGTLTDSDGLALNLDLPNTDTSNLQIKTSLAGINSITIPSNQYYILNDSLQFTLTFSENVYVSGLPSLELDIAGTTVEAVYTSGDSTNSLNFSYTIATPLLDADGIEFNNIKLNSGSILDLANNTVDLSYISPDLTQVKVDSVIPTLDSININSGALYSNLGTATLNLTATEADQMYITMNSDCKSDSAYEPFLTSQSLSLIANSVNTFYVKVRDTNGNESECLNASITHDNQPPTLVSSILIANDASDIATDSSSWSAPTDNGPAGIETYEYAVSTSPDDSNFITGGSWVDTLGQTIFQINTGITLVGGTDYYTLIRAIDKAGNVSSYTVSPSWSIIVSPEPITNLEASNKTVNSVSLGWSYPEDNGTAITDYKIQIKGGSFSDWTLLSDGVSTSTSTSITPLDAETDYQIKVRAFNGINYSGWSNTLTVTTLPNLDFFQGGFKAINISGAPKSRVVSFDDANEIHIDGNLATTLQKGEIYEFDSTDFTTIEGSKALYVGGKLGTGSGSSDQGNATWATQSWVGNKFFFNLTRMAPLKVKVFAFTDSEITIKTGTNTVDTQNVSADSGHVFTLNNYANYQMTSTGLIVAFIYGNASGLIYDPQPLLPVSTDIVGFPSSKAKVTSGTDANSYSFFHTNGNSSSGSLNASTTLSVNPQGTSSLYQSSALRIKTNEPISANSNADSDGYCQAPFVPISMLKKRFGLNADSEWIALASDRPVTVTLVKPDTTTIDVTLTRTGTGKSPYKAYISTDYPAGTILEGTDKFQAWFQPYTSNYSGGDDETIMFGWDE